MFYRNDPFNTLFQELVNRAIDPARPETEAREAQTSHWTPAVDGYLEGEHFNLQVLLAGVDPASVELTAVGNRLTVKGTRERKAPRDARNFRTREVVYGPFERTVELPEGTDASKAEASFEHGVLTIRLPAAGSFVPRKIEIQGAASDSKLHAA